MSITFKDLSNFLITSQSKTLSEASEKLDMSQPSLSLGIQKLEAELGYPLFIRSRSGIRLTPQGTKLVPEAKDALQILGKIKGDKASLKFRIGCHSSVGMFVLGDFLRIMHKEDPSLGFEVINGSSNEINRLVARGEIDFGIVMNPLQLQGLIVKDIGEDDVFVWESKNLYQKKLIYNSLMLQALSILSRWKDAPEETVEVQNLELTAHLVESGAGYGILPAQVVKAQKLNLKRVAGSPSFKDRLSLTCYPEMIKSAEGKMIFAALKRSFKPLG